MRPSTVFLFEVLLLSTRFEQLNAFVSEKQGIFRQSIKDPAHSFIHRISMQNDSNDISIDRRRAIFSFLLPTMTVFGSSKSKANAADDRLFKPNPLTNPLLEKIRVLEQAEADNIKYGGELAPGSPKGQETYAKLLLPILQIQKDLVEVDKLVNMKDGEGLNEALKIISKPQFEKLNFKKAFNAFADNIYYSDPDRANLYLGGGAVPKNEQSIAYLVRNDVLTNVENLQAEIAYLIKEMKAGNALETEDLYLYSNQCKDGMIKYMELVPPVEIKIAQEMLVSR